MRKGTLVLALVIIAIMSSCGNSREFSKRKYTSGVFMRKGGVKKSSEQGRSEYYSEFERGEPVASSNKEASPVALSENTDHFIAGHSDEPEWVNDFVTNELDYELELVTEEENNEQVAPTKKHSILSDSQKISKEKKEKQKKTNVERHSKLSFWFGMTALVLGLTFITMIFLSQSITFSVAWLVYLMARKMMLIFGFIGAGFGVAVFLEKDDSNKYKKQAKIGFWMSVLVLLFFLV